MEIQYFLEERTEFIRYFFEVASRSFLEIHRQIKEGEPPFDNPPHDDGEEPPFLEDYSDAADGLNTVGRTAISMLKQAMEDYFHEWEVRLGAPRDKGVAGAFKKGGMFNGYRYHFENVLGTKWSDSGADLDLLEQVVLARNADQHETRITSRHANHSKEVMERFGDKLHFVSDMERKYRERMRAGEEGFEDALPFWLGHLEVTKDDLVAATVELEKLVAFLEPRLNEKVYGAAMEFPIKE